MKTNKPQLFRFYRRKGRLIEGNAKIFHLKIEVKRQVFICLRPGTPYTPLYKLYTCIQSPYLSTSYREKTRSILGV
jgi:hypothetical protein